MATGQIRLTPEQLRGESQTLLQYSNQHEEIFSKMRTLVENLKSQWEGQAMQAFESSFKTAEVELRKFKESIDTFATNMKLSADQIEQTDSELASRLRV